MGRLYLDAPISGGRMLCRPQGSRANIWSARPRPLATRSAATSTLDIQCAESAGGVRGHAARLRRDQGRRGEVVYGRFTLGFGTRAEGGQALLDVLTSSETLSGQCQGWQPAHGFIAPVALV
jgi:hypothetical protein